MSTTKHLAGIRKMREQDRQRIKAAGQQSGIICFVIAGACFLGVITNTGTATGTGILLVWGAAMLWIGWENFTGRTADRLKQRRLARRGVDTRKRKKEPGHD